uniref:DUF1761 domain-containing protein n=1 Tax=Altererythrobacter segetis TaxID=1104773 RepID=UPI00140AB272|nr:DUF1761 domain-containing protein [Altererythrobacter segetis]
MGTTIHWLAVLVAGVSGFAVGGLWYGPLFLKPWLRAEGKTKEQMGGGHPAMVFGLAFLLNLFSAFILDHVFGTYGNPALAPSLLVAFGVALGFVIPAYGVNYLFAGRKLALFLIDAGYWLVTYLVMGVVLVLLS